MKTEYVMNPTDKERTEELSKRISEIEQEYAETAEERPFMIPKLQKNFRNDWRIRELQKLMADIYKMSVGSYIFIAETEEEKKMLQERFKRGKRV